MATPVVPPKAPVVPPKGPIAPPKTPAEVEFENVWDNWEFDVITACESRELYRYMHPALRQGLLDVATLVDKTPTVYDGCLTTVGDSFWGTFRKGKERDADWHYDTLRKTALEEIEFRLETDPESEELRLKRRETTLQEWNRHGRQAAQEVPPVGQASTSGSRPRSVAKSSTSGNKQAPPSTAAAPVASSSKVKMVPRVVLSPRTAAPTNKPKSAVAANLNAVPPPDARPTSAKFKAKERTRSRTLAEERADIMAGWGPLTDTERARRMKAIKQEPDGTPPLESEGEAAYAPSEDGDESDADKKMGDPTDAENEDGEMEVDPPAVKKSRSRSKSKKAVAGSAASDVEDAPRWIHHPNPTPCFRCSTNNYICTRHVAADSALPPPKGACYHCRNARKGCELAGRKGTVEKTARRKEAAERRAEKDAESDRGAGPSKKKVATASAKVPKKTDDEKAAEKEEKKRTQGLKKASRKLMTTLAKASTSGAAAAPAGLEASERAKYEHRIQELENFKGQITVEMAGVQLQLKAALGDIRSLKASMSKEREPHKDRHPQEPAVAGPSQVNVEASVDSTSAQAEDISVGMIPHIATLQPFAPGTRYVEIDEMDRPVAQALPTHALPTPAVNIDQLAALTLYAAEDAMMEETPAMPSAPAGTSPAPRVASPAPLQTSPAVDDVDMSGDVPEVAEPQPDIAAPPSAPVSTADTPEVLPLSAPIDAPPALITSPAALPDASHLPPAVISSPSAIPGSESQPARDVPVALPDILSGSAAPATPAADVQMADVNLDADVNVDADANVDAVLTGADINLQDDSNVMENEEGHGEVQADGEIEGDANADADGDIEDANADMAAPEPAPAVAPQSKKRERANSHLPPRAPSKRMRRMPPA